MLALGQNSNIQEAKICEKENFAILDDFDHLVCDFKV